MNSSSAIYNSNVLFSYYNLFKEIYEWLTKISHFLSPTHIPTEWITRHTHLQDMEWNYSLQGQESFSVMSFTSGLKYYLHMFFLFLHRGSTHMSKGPSTVCSFGLHQTKVFSRGPRSHCVRQQLTSFCIWSRKMLLFLFFFSLQHYHMPWADIVERKTFGMTLKTFCLVIGLIFFVSSL